ncbi:hypothetical protein QJS66_20750 [Kocuria rhizophila]|nr:hypothetical protein QJS66_20750 [Kocuria rhizophila]
MRGCPPLRWATRRPRDLRGGGPETPGDVGGAWTTTWPRTSTTPWWSYVISRAGTREDRPAPRRPSRPRACRTHHGARHRTSRCRAPPMQVRGCQSLSAPPRRG